VGSRGTTKTDGATLRAKLGLFDTWAYFTAISGEKAPADADPSGGATAPRSFSFRWPKAVGELRGTVIGGGSRGIVQAFRDGRWTDVGDVTTRRGAYRYAATVQGTYRVVFSGAAGPSVRL
jgi:stage II sporulation protein D